MTLQGDYMNCYFSGNCPDCDKEGCKRCKDYIPLKAKAIEKMGDELFQYLYGYGAPLRTGE